MEWSTFEELLVSNVGNYIWKVTLDSLYSEWRDGPI